MSPGPDDSVSRRLILLTNEYPFDRGDATFVQNEISALASAYSDVVVFNYPSAGSQEMQALPPGVRYGGSLKEADNAGWLAMLLRPRVIARFLRTFVDELRHRRVGRKIYPVLLNTLASMRRAEHPALKSAIREAPNVSVYSFWAMGAGLAVACLPRVSGTVAVRLHRYDLYEEVIGWLPLRGSILTRPDVLLPISRDGAEYLERRYPWRDRAPVVVSRLGTVDHGLGAGPNGHGVTTVVSCSSLTPVKRVDLIARAVASLSDSVQVRWVHFGDGPLSAELHTLAERLGSDRLQIELRGHTQNDAIMDFYRDSPVDVFVNASESEGVPVSIMEAMSFDIPVVATRVGGVAEIVDESLGSGTCVPAEVTAAELADALWRVVKRTDLNARRTWQQLSNTDTNTKTLLEVLGR